jgi:hypothetical protein
VGKKLQTVFYCYVRFNPLEEYAVTCEYLPGKKNDIADALFHLNINSMKIQKEEA